MYDLQTPHNYTGEVTKERVMSVHEATLEVYLHTSNLTAACTQY